MRLSRIHVGDVVRCDVRGRLFYGVVTAISPADKPSLSRVSVDPITNNVSYESVKPRQVIAVWRKLAL
ncbi:MAG: hypothetical protein EBV64_11860 [Oxalobacteraceae bacterium]|jgi:hypothetical protein|nr:hypothetical protein [Oxalobacteraceae bacterium]